MLSFKVTWVGVREPRGERGVGPGRREGFRGQVTEAGTRVWAEALGSQGCLLGREP